MDDSLYKVWLNQRCTKTGWPKPPEPAEFAEIALQMREFRDKIVFAARIYGLTFPSPYNNTQQEQIHAFTS